MLARRLWVFLSVLGLVALPHWVFAQPSLKVTSHAATDHPNVGEPFGVEMTIAGDGALATLSSPVFNAPGAFSVNGPSVSSRSSTSIINGVASSHASVTLEWTLIPSAAGTFVLPSPSVEVGGQIVRGSPMTVIVAGGGGANPMDPHDFQPAQDVDDQGIVKSLELPSGPPDEVFIHAIADKTSAVVGEQVTVSFYIYFRVNFSMTDHKEAALADFLRIPLLTDPSTTIQQTTTVGGKRYGVRLIDRIAAFPLRAGKLHTGAVSARFTTRHLGADTEVHSDETVIDVTEPPESGRPAGYVMGTVGKYSLDAVVLSRKTQQGSPIPVKVTVRGVGNVPTELKMPEHAGVEEWSDPQRHDAIVSPGDKIGGSRTLSYVVTLNQPGAFDLGSVDLPYYNPDTHSYETASVPLGTVDVRPAVLKSAGGNDRVEDDLLANLPQPRAKLSPYDHPDGNTLPMWGLGSAIAFPPLLVGFGFGATEIGRRIVRRRKRLRESGATKVRDALASAKAAEKKGDVKELAASVERAVHAAIEDATALKSRGVMRDGLEDEFVRRGIAKDAAKGVSELLAQCELMRFTPTADAETMAGLVARATTLVKDLRPSKAA